MLSLIAMWGKGLGLTKGVGFSLITRLFSSYITLL